MESKTNADRLLLVDGHNLLFQMFFGLPDRIADKNGNPIQGVVGFAGALRKLIALVNPTHLAVLFDSERPSERAEIFSEYKGNRTDYSQAEDNVNPFSQLKLVYSALDVLGVAHCEADGGETDDIIASYVFAFGKDTEIFISSFDSDYFQLITDNVKVLRYRGAGSAVCDREFILSRFGIEPRLYASFKALTGDASDNIKGVSGVGPKTACKLVNAFGDVHSLLENVGKIDDVRLQAKIQSNADIILRNYSLIALTKRLPLPFGLEDMRSFKRQFTTAEVLRELNLR